MNRNGLILLQALGGLSILPYPFVFLANIMSIAAPGHNPSNTIPLLLLCLYPLVWIALDLFAWRAMSRGSVGLAFGLSSIPAAAAVLLIGVYLFSWIGFGLGMAGIGKGGLHTTIINNSNPLADSILDPGPGATEKALQQIEAHPALVNLNVPGRGSPLYVALSSLSFGLAGSIEGDPRHAQDRIRLVRALVARGALLNADESAGLRTAWNLRRALYDGPVTTSSENPLVWRIVTHDRGDSKPWNPLTDPLPPRREGPRPFVLKPSDIPLLNRATRLHGTPLYAALLERTMEAYNVIIPAGARLSAEEQRDRAAQAALREVLERHPDRGAGLWPASRHSCRLVPAILTPPT